MSLSKKLSSQLHEKIKQTWMFSSFESGIEIFEKHCVESDNRELLNEISSDESIHTVELLLDESVEFGEIGRKIRNLVGPAYNTQLFLENYAEFRHSGRACYLEAMAMDFENFVKSLE